MSHLCASELLTETRVPIAALAKREGVAVSTCWRWCTNGVGGHRLESFTVGGRKFTTEESFARWVEATNGPNNTIHAATSSAANRRSIDAAEAEADRLGI